MGVTLATEIAGGAALGWALVRLLAMRSEDWLAHERTFIVGGAICGIIVGLYTFLKSALRAMHEQDQ